MSDEEDTGVRIANALERIAAAMEMESNPGPIEHVPASKGIIKPNLPKRRVENINERQGGKKMADAITDSGGVTPVGTASLHIGAFAGTPPVSRTSGSAGDGAAPSFKGDYNG